MGAIWVDDDKRKLDYHSEKRIWNYECFVKPNNETFDNNDNVKTKTNTKHMKRDTGQVNVHEVFLLFHVVFASSYSLIAYHIAWLKFRFCLISYMHEVSVTLRLIAHHSFQLPSLFILRQAQAVLAAFPFPRS